jgi:hypothetical protein
LALGKEALKNAQGRKEIKLCILRELVLSLMFSMENQVERSFEIHYKQKQRAYA